MRGSMVIRLRPCMIVSTPLPRHHCSSDRTVIFDFGRPIFTPLSENGHNESCKKARTRSFAKPSTAVVSTENSENKKIGAADGMYTVFFPRNFFCVERGARAARVRVCVCASDKIGGKLGADALQLFLFFSGIVLERSCEKCLPSPSRPLRLFLCFFLRLFLGVFVSGLITSSAHAAVGGGQDQGVLLEALWRFVPPHVEGEVYSVSSPRLAAF